MPSHGDSRAAPGRLEPRLRCSPVLQSGLGLLFMTDQINPLATHYLPPFITAPGQTDALLVRDRHFLMVVIFFWHRLPCGCTACQSAWPITARSCKFEVVAILCLLALFTHNNLLWGIALIPPSSTCRSGDAPAPDFRHA